MAIIARILGLSLLTGGLGAGLGMAVLGPLAEALGISLLLACVGGIIGAIAAAAREIVTAMGRDPSSSGKYSPMRTWD